MSDDPDFTMTYPCHLLIGAGGGYVCNDVDGHNCLCVFTSLSTIQDFALFILREQYGPDCDKVTNIPGTMCRDDKELIKLLQSSESELTGSGIFHMSIDPQPGGTTKYTTIREIIEQLPHEPPRMDHQRVDRQGGSMKEVIAVVLLLVAAFCVYGFIATVEPGPNHLYFRIGYTIVGIVCLVAAIAMMVRKK
jgi:hypothetical protein